jgi:murein DD-endopeptidase MepM/ murein hydrolase activator NlpD
MKRPRALVVLLTAALLAPVTARTSAQEGARMVFPVTRSEWYSVINFRDDWHAPRMRLLPDGSWELSGYHEGNDIFAEPGTPVVAVLDGTVEQLGWTFYSGWRVGIRGVDGRYWFYAHLQRFAPGLAIGTPVAAGRVIGEVGNTGYGATPGHRDEFTYHLHLGIQEPDGTWVNPYPLVRRLYDAAVKQS